MRKSEKNTGDWLNFHTNHKSDRRLRDLLNNAAAYRGAYITDIFRDISANGTGILQDIKAHPAKAKKALDSLKKEIAFVGGKNPRIYLLGTAVEKIMTLYAPELITANILLHPSCRSASFLEDNRRILALN